MFFFRCLERNMYDLVKQYFKKKKFKRTFDLFYIYIYFYSTNMVRSNIKKEMKIKKLIN